MIVNQILWRRLYRHESASQRSWRWAVRGLRDALIRIPETLEGVVLESTKDPVTDLTVALGVHPSDRKQVQDAIKFLLADGYIVHVDGALLIRNFREAQTGSSAAEIDEAAPAPRASSSRPGNPDLSAIRAEAGRRGGLKAQASKQVASSKLEQNTKQVTKQNLEQTKQVAPSKPEQSASARDPEDQRREEENTKEKPADLKTGQVIARMGPPVLACGLQEAGASTRQERQRPTFGALNCEPPTTARAIEVPEVMKTYAIELGLSENQYSDVLTDFREKVKDPQGAHRLMSLLFRFIEAKAKGSPSGPSVAPAVRLERERRAAAAEEERQRWQSEQEAQATKEAREQLLAVGIDPDRPSPEAIKNLMTGIGGG